MMVFSNGDGTDFLFREVTYGWEIYFTRVQRTTQGK